MATDRKFLSGVGFIRPAIKGDPHLRISKKFYKTIGDLDAFIVYGILRSGAGPTHNWTTKRVKTEIDKRFRGENNRGVGRDRVEKALALLNREGWIRYIDLMEPNGQQRGAAIEVHYERLPEALRRKNRKIRFRPDGKFTMHECDGTVVPPEDYEPKSSISKNDNPAGGAESTKGAAYSDKHTKPHPRNPEERSPGERISVEQYKGDNKYKGNLVEESPEPLSGKGDFDFLFDQYDFPGKNDVEPTADPLPLEPDPSQPGEPVPVSPAPAPAPAPDPDPGTREVSVEPVQASAAVASPSASFDVQALWQMADGIKGDADLRYEFEVFVFERVFPVLKPPPEHSVWKKQDALDWCRSSAMGRLFLSLSKDSDWTPELARRFVKNSGTFRTEFMREILLSGRNPRKWGTLNELLNTGRAPTRDLEDKIVNHWKALCEWARDELQSVKRNLQATLKKFSAHENDPALIASSAQFRQKLFNDESCHEYEDSLFLAVQSFRAAFRSVDLPSHLHSAEFVARRDEQRSALERAFASNLPFLAVAWSIPNPARLIWGVKVGEVLVLRWQTGQKLKRRAQIHGITWDGDFLVTTTIERCRRIISQMPFDETARRLCQTRNG